MAALSGGGKRVALAGERSVRLAARKKKRAIHFREFSQRTKTASHKWIIE
jgi:hypothetical protein